MANGPEAETQFRWVESVYIRAHLWLMVWFLGIFSIRTPDGRDAHPYLI